MVPDVTPMRRQQLQVVHAVVARLRGDGTILPPWSLTEVQMAGLATGLTALGAQLGVFDRSVPGVGDHLDEQVGQVAARHERFAALTPRVLEALAAADVAAVPVKGAVLAGHAGDAPVWPDPTLRPMSDIDVLVAPHQRAQAGAALTGSGCRHLSSSDHEDTYLAWGDGGVGRTDGESADHNGRVEVHPGWTEFLHGYLARGFDVPGRARRHDDGQARLAPGAFAAHVIGHLASTVVRAEVRAVNVLDVWFLHGAGLDWQAVADAQRDVDPRLTAPGLWLADRLLPDVVPADLLGRELARLPHPAVLDRTEPAALLRDPSQRTTARWRAAFALTAAERARVAAQLAASARARVRRR